LYRTGILGTGFYLPPRVVTNDDLAKLMDTSDEWIQQRTGIRERRYIDEGISGATMGREASAAALDEAGMDAGDIDAIIYATLSSDRFFPGNAVFLQAELGNHGSVTLDVRNQCTGFLYALSIADQFIKTGKFENVLVCGGEIHSTGIELNDRGRDVAVIFGDGAGAFVLGREKQEGKGILSTHLHGEGKNARLLWTECEGAASRPNLTPEMVQDGRIFPQMKGKRVFMQAIQRFPEVINEALEANGVTKDEVDCFLFHQANQRITEFVCNQMGIPLEKTLNNIDVYGNTTAATIPICFHEARQAGLIKKGSLVLASAFGAGLTWASALIRY